MQRTVKLEDLLETWTLYETTSKQPGCWRGTLEVGLDGQVREGEPYLSEASTTRIEHKLVRPGPYSKFYCLTCQGNCSVLTVKAEPTACKVQAERL